MPATISVNFATQAEVEGSSPPTNKSISARVLRDVLGGGGVAGGYVTLAGTQTITGAKTFSATLTTATINSSSTYQINGVNRLYGTTQDPYANIRVLQNLTTSTAEGMRGMYINFDSTGGTAADCRFYARGQNQRMIIKADTGNIGIGTSEPSSRLHVNGEIRATNVNVGGATATIGRVQLIQGNATNPGYIAWFRPDGTTRIGYQGWGSPGGNTHLSLQLENDANFKTYGGQVIVHPPGSGNNTILKPTAWTGGISSLDIYATGSVGAGPSNSSSGAFAFMDSNGRLSIRAAATASAAVRIPVFTANPASSTREVETRTPAQLLADMGGLTSGGTAASASVLSPGRQINGTLFTGGANITTANWGTTRAISIGGTSKNVNGGVNVTWTTAEITAGAVTNGVYTVGNQSIDGTKTFNGNVRTASFGVGTNASGTAGEIRATNNITAFFSDERLKTFLGKIPNSLEKISSLNGYYFKENEKAKSLGYNNDKIQVGVNAQEVERILPEVVTLAPIDTDIDENGNLISKSGENIKTVYYDKLVPLLIEAIKELNEKIKNLESKLNS